jgi:hypothetical protein
MVVMRVLKEELRKTNYTCKGFRESKGGRGWNEEGMLRFCDLEAIADQTRIHGRHKDMERRIKEAYVVKSNNSHEEEGDEDGGRAWGRVQREHMIVVITNSCYTSNNLNF